MSISFSTAVTPEGSNNYVLQGYLRTTVDLELLMGELKTFVAEPLKWFDLTDEEGESNLLLIEATMSTMKVFAKVAVEVLQFAHQSRHVPVCVLMFDGAFVGGALLDESISDQVFGFTTSRLGPVLCMDRDVLTSDSWQSLISLARSTEPA